MPSEPQYVIFWGGGELSFNWFSLQRGHQGFWELQRSWRQTHKARFQRVEKGQGPLLFGCHTKATLVGGEGGGGLACWSVYAGHATHQNQSGGPSTGRNGARDHEAKETHPPAPICPLSPWINGRQISGAEILPFWETFWGSHGPIKGEDKL